MKMVSISDKLDFTMTILQSEILQGLLMDDVLISVRNLSSITVVYLAEVFPYDNTDTKRLSFVAIWCVYMLSEDNFPRLLTHTRWPILLEMSCF